MSEHLIQGPELDKELINEIRQQLSQLLFGTLEIQVHRGKVVQIERREKKLWGKGENAKQL